MGEVVLQGIGIYRNYYREALDKRGITVNLMRVGTYKSFAEPYIANGPSPAAAEAEAYVFGGMGGLSKSALIKKAREDERVKAVVLRVNSGGGSAFGSEMIRRELELTRAAGKPVVVSMGNVAASGGYWISMAADEVIADPSTITGSIGGPALPPTADKAPAKIGAHN